MVKIVMKNVVEKRERICTLINQRDPGNVLGQNLTQCSDCAAHIKSTCKLHTVQSQLQLHINFSGRAWLDFRTQ